HFGRVSARLLRKSCGACEQCKLVSYERECGVELRAVRGHVRPAARAGGMGQRDDGHAVVLVARADALGELREPEQAPERETADGHDELRPQELELPVAPELAQLLLARRRRAVAAPGRRAARVTPGHRGTVEGPVEGLLVELEPAAQRAACPAAPREPLLSLVDTWSLSVHIGALVVERRPHRRRLEWVPGLDARAAARQVALERGERAIRRPADRHWS